MKVNAYLAFRGNCEQAINFYAGLFGGNITNKITYQDSDRDIPESYRNNLQHIELKGNDIHILAYDASPDTPITQGNNIHMSVDVDDKESAKDIFDSLTEGGKIHQNFQEMEWDAYYGRCTDKYGINWMINSKK